MSQENVEIVQRVIDARNRGDPDAAFACAAPDIEFDFSASAGPWAGIYRGIEAVTRLWEGMDEVFSEFRWEPQEFIDAGDAVVVPMRFHSRGRGSGVETVTRGAQVYWLKDGQVVRYRQCRNRAEALEAVGLRASAMSEGDQATTFRRAMEAYSRGDYDAAVLDFDPAIEWSVDVSVTPDATTYHGHEGVKRFWETWAEAISGMELEIEECRGVGQDRVLAIVRAHGMGAGSGAPVVSPRFAEVVDFRDGLVVKVRVYGGVAAALKAAGLRD